MKKVYPYFLCLFFMAFPKYNQAQILQWAKSVGGLNNDKGFKIFADSLGNVYTVGVFNDTVDFDPGPNTQNLISNGGGDIFISKNDFLGNLVWAKSIGGPNYEQANDILVDSIGNCYVIGNFGGTVDFDPGLGTYNLSFAGAIDIFILKLNSLGNFVWAKRVGGPGADIPTCMKLSHAGDLYITGTFENLTDFDPGIGIHNLMPSGNQDFFVVKVDALGSFKNAINIGGPGWIWSYDMDIDYAENILLIGKFYQTVDFDPGPNMYNLTDLNGDIFICKLDSQLNFKWAKRIGGVNIDEGDEIETDQNGNVYASGDYRSTVDFNPGNGTYYLSNSGSQDIFILKLNKSGSFLWAKRLGSAQDEGINDMFLDESNNIHFVGVFHDSLDMDPGNNIFPLYSSGLADIFMLDLNSHGNFLSAIGLGGMLDDVGMGITVNLQKNIYITGYFSDIANFNYFSTSNLVSNGNYDMFIAKYISCTEPPIQISAAGSTTFCQGDSVILSAFPPWISPQWYRNNTMITGAIYFDYTATVKGEYYCMGSDSTFCASTSNLIRVEVPCIPIDSASSRIANFINSVDHDIFPNPTNGIFEIKSISGSVQIFDSFGKLVYTKVLTPDENTIDLSRFSEGIYLGQFRTLDSNYSIRIVLTH